MYLPTTWHFVPAFALASIVLVAPAKGQTLQPTPIQTNGTVEAVALDTVNGIMFLGGSFSHVGLENKNGVIVDPVTDLMHGDGPDHMPDGYVDEAVADGHGGWYIAGSFDHIGGLPCPGLAHVDSTGNLIDDLPTGDLGFHPDYYGAGALAVDGNKLYVGGGFRSIGPDLAFGTAVSWPAGVTNTGLARPNNDVLAAASDGAGGWYIGGAFDGVSSEPRAHLAWLLADGSLHPWAPTANADVHQIVIVDTIAFLIGDFTQINGLPRNSIAAVHAITGDLLPWDPHPDWAVHSMIIYNDQAILAGYFHSIGDSLRESIAFLDLATLTITGLDLGLSVASQITSMDLEGDKLYMAGPIDVLGVSRPSVGVSVRFPSYRQCSARGGTQARWSLVTPNSH